MGGVGGSTAGSGITGSSGVTVAGGLCVCSGGKGLVGEGVILSLREDDGTDGMRASCSCCFLDGDPTVPLLAVRFTGSSVCTSVPSVDDGAVLESCDIDRDDGVGVIASSDQGDISGEDG